VWSNQKFLDFCVKHLWGFQQTFSAELCTMRGVNSKNPQILARQEFCRFRLIINTVYRRHLWYNLTLTFAKLHVLTRLYTFSQDIHDYSKYIDAGKLLRRGRIKHITETEFTQAASQY